MLLELVPGKGIGPALLGATRDEVRGALAAIHLPLGATHGSVDYFADNALQIDYVDDRVSFIGVASGAPFECSIDGVDPFDMAAPELFALLAQIDGGNHTFNEYDYLFPARIVTLWDADPQYDRKRRALVDADVRPVWGQVGIGNDAYVSAISAAGRDR